MPAGMLFRWQTLCLFLFILFDVTLTQDEEECTVAAEGISTWESLTAQIPYRSNIDPSNLTIVHNISTSNVCPSYSSGYSIDELSLCPWTYHMDTDYNRYPVNMPYAVCTCGRCGLPRLGKYPHCTPLQHSFQVLRRVCQNGVYRYVFTHERFPIACVCTYRPVTYVTAVPRN